MSQIVEWVADLFGLNGHDYGRNRALRGGKARVIVYIVHINPYYYIANSRLYKTVKIVNDRQKVIALDDERRLDQIFSTK